ncbi:hypothetical protein [Clostridium perfringens]|uniref:hypothetical protein n=1 Tax=Clostridium perfringens TaxID=1502 RepID=UPI0039EBB0AC
MSVATFKETIWEKNILENFAESSFVGLITTPPTEVKGEKVVFNRITSSAWKDYVSGSKITWEQVATSMVEMSFNKSKYWSFMIDDIDKCQTAGDVMKAVTKEQSNLLGELVSQEVVKYIINNTKEENVIHKVGSPLKVTNANTYDTLVDMNVHMSDQKVPMADRFFIISNKILGMLEKDERFTKNYTILENGLVDGANINGTKLIVRADNPQDKILLTQKSGTGYAMQIDETEAMRLQDYICDGCRGLVNYGYVQLRDNCSVVANITV